MPPPLPRGGGVLVIPPAYHHPMPDDDVFRDANGYRNDQAPNAVERRRQTILNESWPFKDSAGRHARGLEDQPVANQRPVWVRLEFERDGEQILPGRAFRWNRSHVLVSVDDERVARPGVWVRAKDVRRRV